ncbi:putative LRR receptor-like serine/threonine-protein kinase [Iris pallida]|uniref:LRR receptor-like serine/threonine-protein kinase n=1 Tax=Iris pallida TaxID=29817 RepID=A0AAX6FUS6_IRIPA|nr:putative LRR receptor-like serine/threonine-protein kinase [Iris pallida]
MLIMAGILSCQSPPITTARHCSLPRRRSSSTSSSSRKHSDRLLSSLSAVSDPSSADRVVRKFIASSSKSTALHTLSLLLSRSSPSALSAYRRISETHWFRWSPKLAADVISLLESSGASSDADLLLSDSVSRLSSHRDLGLFYCHLIDAASERNLHSLVLESYEKIKSLISFSGRKPYESMIRGLSTIGMPADAEDMLDEMSQSGFKPSRFEYRSVIQGYGKLGHFADMERVVRTMTEEEEEKLDTVSANQILSCYGEHGRLSEMVVWTARMRALGVGFSVRTFNTVLNSCPNLVSMVTDRDLRATALPLSVEDLMGKLQGNGDEGLLVREMVGSPLLVEALKWSRSEAELDLHGFHLVPAYVVILQWMEEVRCRLRGGVSPMEISIVCGSGKHSSVRGESPLRKLVSEIMAQLKSPMKIDRKNVGRFVAKGKTVRDWLCC